jgi:hypothetical protein
MDIPWRKPLLRESPERRFPQPVQRGHHGRTQREYLVHPAVILCDREVQCDRIADAKSHTRTHADPDSDTHTHAKPDSHTNTDPHAHSNSAYANTDTDTLAAPCYGYRRSRPLDERCGLDHHRFRRISEFRLSGKRGLLPRFWRGYQAPKDDLQ